MWAHWALWRGIGTLLTYCECRQLFTQGLAYLDFDMSDSSLTSLDDTMSRDTSPASLSPATSPAPSAATTPRKHFEKDVFPNLLKLKQSKGANHLHNKTFPQTKGLSFASSTIAASAVGQIAWQSPSPDATIPQTQDDDKAIVLRIRTALRSVEFAHDKEKSAYRKMIIGDTYKDWQLEACAWQILVSPLFPLI